MTTTSPRPLEVGDVDPVTEAVWDGSRWVAGTYDPAEALAALARLEARLAELRSEILAGSRPHLDGTLAARVGRLRAAGIADRCRAVVAAAFPGKFE